jgi:hypothetical protein
MVHAGVLTAYQAKLAAPPVVTVSGETVRLPIAGLGTVEDVGVPETGTTTVLTASIPVDAPLIGAQSNSKVVVSCTEDETVWTPSLELFVG